MDILQQSLQAADILSGEDNDLFGELGISFNNSSTGNSGLGEEFSSLASQSDALHSSNSGGLSQSSSFSDFNRTNNSTPVSSFDTSQFLNTSASINTPSSLPSEQYGIQNSYQQMSKSFETSFTTSSMQYTTQQVTYTTPYRAAQSGQLQKPSNSVSQYNSPNITSVPIFPTTTVQSATQASFNPVNIRSPAPTLNFNNDSKRPLTPNTNIQSSLPPGIRIANTISLDSTNTADLNHFTNTKNAMPSVIRSGTPVLQNSTNTISQGSRQIVTLVQAPTIVGNSSLNQNIAQRNGLNVQQQSITNHNVAVLKVAGTKQSINITDPQLVKAITSNLMQKKQEDVQRSGQQFMKLDRNNPVINVVQHRSQTQTQLRGLQQITLQNGQTILLNNGQQVQLCTGQSQAGQIQVVQPASQTVISSMRNLNPQPTKSPQLPIKGIQIASVSIPVASSSTSTPVNVASVSSSRLTIPLQTKQDLGQNTVTTTSIVTPTVAITQMNSSQTQNSATVRSLLANSILKQNNTMSVSTSSVNSVQSQQMIATTVASNGQVSNVQRPQIGPTLRLNLTPQQASQLTPAQLQTILKQHRATLQAKALANVDVKKQTQAIVGQSVVVSTTSTTPTMTAQPVSSALTDILRPTSTSSMVNVSSNGNTAVVNKPTVTASEQQAVQLFRVDPTLTEAQVDEVKKLLTNRTIASKLSTLSREQQQLVLAFQAQIKAMSPPVQQYYLRNPQLFMQKVLNQIRAGRPFMLQVKVDSQRNKRGIATVNQPSQSQHPTISLTQDQSKTKGLAAATTLSATSPAHASISIPASPINKPVNFSTITVQVPKKAVKRPASDVPAKMSLVLEQLECHKKMACTPDCTQPFKCVRDAIRRLVPFHTCNIPNIKQEDFDESEKIFDKISDRIVTRTRAMINKYHLLCLRDSTKDSCSAEMVMIERMFLQREKAKLAEDKARLKENPSLIKEYFPNHFSALPKTASSIEGSDTGGTSDGQQQTIQLDTYLRTGNETDSSAYDPNLSVDSPLLNMNLSSTHYVNNASDSDCRSSSGSRFLSHDSACSPASAKRRRHESMESVSQGSCEEILLQEAVESILT